MTATANRKETGQNFSNLTSLYIHVNGKIISYFLAQHWPGQLVFGSLSRQSGLLG